MPLRRGTHIKVVCKVIKCTKFKLKRKTEILKLHEKRTQLQTLTGNSNQIVLSQLLRWVNSLIKLRYLPDGRFDVVFFYCQGGTIYSNDFFCSDNFGRTIYSS